MMSTRYNAEFLHSIYLSNPYGRYLEDGELRREDAVTYAVDSGLKLLAADGIETIPSIDSAGNIAGVLVFRVSEWDTSHFGKKTVIIEHIWIVAREASQREKTALALAAEFYRLCQVQGIEFVSAKISSLDLPVIHALERIGFSFIESWIYSKHNLKKQPEDAHQLLELRASRPTDLDFMLKYSQNAFSTQRFHADKNISYEKAEMLYQKWIRTAFFDEHQKILVYDHEGIPCAFMVYYLNDLSRYFNRKFAMWKFALLNPDIRGQGIGIRFFRSLFANHIREGCDVVDSGVSLRNIASLNTHNRTDFKIISTLANFHLWMNQGE